MFKTRIQFREKHQFAEKSGGSFEEPARLDFRLVEEDQKAMEIASKEMEKYLLEILLLFTVYILKIKKNFTQNLTRKSKYVRTKCF
jgi:hypothetical protein